jgi:hypothetical protein
MAYSSCTYQLINEVVRRKTGLAMSDFVNWATADRAGAHVDRRRR